MSCSISRMLRPVSRSFSISFRMVSASSWFMPATGSSSSNSFGRAVTARAISTLRWMP